MAPRRRFTLLAVAVAGAAGAGCGAGRFTPPAGAVPGAAGGAMARPWPARRASVPSALRSFISASHCLWVLQARRRAIRSSSPVHSWKLSMGAAASGCPPRCRAHGWNTQLAWQQRYRPPWLRSRHLVGRATQPPRHGSDDPC